MEKFNKKEKVEFLGGLNKFYRKVLDTANSPIQEVDITNLKIISNLVSEVIYTILEGK